MFLLVVDDEKGFRSVAEACFGIIWPFRSVAEAQKRQLRVQRTLFFSTFRIKELLIQIYIYSTHL